MANTILVAFGGNAVLRPGQRGTHEEQLENILNCCQKLIELIKEGYTMVITHGNGPQVGNLLIQNEAASNSVPAQPLDSCVAQTQGQIGYMLQLGIDNVARQNGLAIEVASIVTRVLVDEGDRAFQVLTKPIGPFFSESYARERQTHGETWIDDSNRGWRRVVPSPQPVQILELELIRHAFDRCGIIIAAGGGGIPVVKRDNQLFGVEAVIDKDLASSLLARELDIDTFVMLTDVRNVKLNFGLPNEMDVYTLTVEQAEKYIKEGQFGVGSMAPKIQAAVDFVRARGKRAVITSLDEVVSAIRGKAGTEITL